MKILEIVKEWLRMPEEIRRLRELNQALVTTNTVRNNELHTIKKDLLACQQSNLPDKKASYWNNKWVKNEVKYLARAGFEMDVRNLILTKSYVLQPVANKLKRSSHDETVLAIHDYVKKRLVYTPDITENGVEEWWEDSEICWGKRKSDCEDGSILIASLAVLAGIPSYKIKIVAGWASNPNGTGLVGHAYNIYLASDDEWYVLDWTYYPEKSKNNFLKVPHGKIPEYGEVWWTATSEYTFSQKEVVLKDGGLQ